MIHTKVTPNDVLVSISFYVPKSYIGKELDVIAFAPTEGLQKNESNFSEKDRKELTNRVESYLQNPTKVIPWKEVKKNIRKQL